MYTVFINLKSVFCHICINLSIKLFSHGRLTCAFCFPPSLLINWFKKFNEIHIQFLGKPHVKILIFYFIIRSLMINFSLFVMLGVFDTQSLNLIIYYVIRLLPKFFIFQLEYISKENFHFARLSVIQCPSNYKQSSKASDNDLMTPL